MASIEITGFVMTGQLEAPARHVKPVDHHDPAFFLMIEGYEIALEQAHDKARRRWSRRPMVRLIGLENTGGDAQPFAVAIFEQINKGVPSSAVGFVHSPGSVVHRH